MSITAEQINQWLNEPEHEVLELKEARRGLHFDTLAEYCCALANEGGGYLVLGVSDQRPRTVKGTDAYRYEHLQSAKANLTRELRLKIEVHEVDHPQGRVVVFRAPNRPLGMPISYKGTHWMRAGESLVHMTSDRLREIFAEAIRDVSSEIVQRAQLKDLDPMALLLLREKWHRKSGNPAILNLNDEQLLADLNLLDEEGVTVAALVLCGTERALQRYLGSAEVIFEYRSLESMIEFEERKEFRSAFLLYENDLWELINKRNGVQEYQVGFVRDKIITFNEQVVREAILNAVCHREYWTHESTFVRQYQRRLEVVSPGGFPSGITPENLIWKQAPRNRLLAETLARCGYVERSGQGADVMFRESIKEGKPNPDFTETDSTQVYLTLRCEVQEPAFVQFLEKLGQEKLRLFSTEDFLALDLIHRKQPIPERLKSRLTSLTSLGVLERFGRRYILSRGFYEFLDKKGEYTRERGLDRETNKALLQRHISDNAHSGSRLQELLQVLPSLSEGQVQGLLREMRDERRVHPKGKTKGAKWYPGADPQRENLSTENL